MDNSDTEVGRESEAHGPRGGLHQPCIRQMAWLRVWASEHQVD